MLASAARVLLARDFFRFVVVWVGARGKIVWRTVVRGISNVIVGY